MIERPPSLLPRGVSLCENCTTCTGSSGSVAIASGGDGLLRRNLPVSVLALTPILVRYSADTSTNAKRREIRRQSVCGVDAHLWWCALLSIYPNILTGSQKTRFNTCSRNSSCNPIDIIIAFFPVELLIATGNESPSLVVALTVGETGARPKAYKGSSCVPEWRGITFLLDGAGNETHSLNPHPRHVRGPLRAKCTTLRDSRITASRLFYCLPLMI